MICYEDLVVDGPAILAWWHLKPGIMETRKAEQASYSEMPTRCICSSRKLREATNRFRLDLG
jgi:hypothetical protein